MYIHFWVFVFLWFRRICVGLFCLKQDPRTCQKGKKNIHTLEKIPRARPSLSTVFSQRDIWIRNVETSLRPRMSLGTFPRFWFKYLVVKRRLRMKGEHEVSFHVCGCFFFPFDMWKRLWGLGGRWGECKSHVHCTPCQTFESEIWIRYLNQKFESKIWIKRLFTTRYLKAPFDNRFFEGLFASVLLDRMVGNGW